MKFWRSSGDFLGGIPLLAQKTLSSEKPIRTTGIPPRLLYALDLGSGHQAVPIVKAGDYVRSGTPIAVCPDDFDPPICATSSGTIFFLEGPHASASAASLIGIETDGLDLKAESFDPLDGTTCSREAALRRLHDCGVLGMGGAGFPAASKIKRLGGLPKLLIVNGAECEPYLTCDERVIRERAPEILTAAELLSGIFNIPKVVIAVESSRTDALAAIRKALHTGHYPRCDLFALPERYPAGGERQMIQSISGLEMQGGTHPVDHGILCFNIQTLHAAGRALLKGEVLTHRIITLSGTGITEPSNLEVLIGTPIDDLIAGCGGLRNGDQHIILGGPMMGISVSNTQIPITKTTSALLVLDASDRPKAMEPIEHPCIRCGACTDVCPQGLLPQSLHDQVRAHRITELENLHLLDCIECGCCDVVCPSLIPLTQEFRSGKKDLRRYLADEVLAAKAQSRHEARMNRLKREQMERDQEADARKTALGQGAQPRIQEALERARLKREQRLQQTDTPSSHDA